MTDRPAIPLASLVLGYGPVLLLGVLALGAWLLPVQLQGPCVVAGWLWGSAILLFLSGVVRGLSFFSPGGPHRAQLAMMMWLFLLGLGALVVRTWIAFGLLALGYLSIAVFDPRAAAHGLAPKHFARLRPPQMAIAVVALIALLVRASHG